jgi:hypothetical protein
MIVAATLTSPVALGMAVTMESFIVGSRETDALVSSMRVEGHFLVLQLVPGCSYLKTRKLERGSLRIPLTQVAHVLDNDETSKTK